MKHRHPTRRSVLLGTAAIGVAASGSYGASRPQCPNVLLILADDMGFSDPGYMGGDIKTPHLDRLARGGVLFTQCYNEAKCSPTRAALLTGRSSRFVLKRNEGKLTEDEDLAEGIPTLAGHMREAGYRTYLSGKWHLGDEPAQWPIERGFDEAFGLITGASSYFEMRMREAQDDPAQAANWPPKPFMVEGRSKWTPPKEGFYMTDAITERAVSMLKSHHQDHRSQPFFLYLAYTAPHWPLHAPPEDIESYKGCFDEGWDVVRARRLGVMKQRGLIPSDAQPAKLPASVPSWAEAEDKPKWARRMEVYAAQITAMDRGIGRVLDQLHASGCLENTLVVFLSDNGATKESMASNFGYHNPGAPIGTRATNTAYQEPWAAVSNTPLRSYKRFLFEGGIRTSMIAHWPAGLQSPGRRSEMPVHVIDIAPTLLGLTGYLPEGSRFQGVDISPWIRRRSATKARALFWSFNDEQAAREGCWKIVRSSKQAPWELYDIAVDPGETRDLAAQRPQMVAHLDKAWLQWAAGEN